MRGHERVDIDRAIALYDQLGTWTKVAKLMRRKNGENFTPDAISRAVRLADHTNAVGRSGADTENVG
jgi:hypothetical protein